MPANICWENASKTINDFVPAAIAENYGNWTAENGVVRDADTLSMNSRVDG